MASVRAGAILRHIHQLVEAHGAPSDGQLLQRFTAQREEAAFAALLRRHRQARPPTRRTRHVGILRRLLAGRETLGIYYLQQPFLR